MSWISVKDKLPEVGVEVFIIYKQRKKFSFQTKESIHVTVGYRSLLKNGEVTWRGGYDVFRGSKICSEKSTKDFFMVTHWMVIPELPNE